MNQKIIEPVATELIEAELTPERFLRHSNKGGNDLYVVTSENAPNVMREIGRLREIAFRTAGGGTGKECDIDSFDTMTPPCSQLIVWDPEKKLILGGYRFILGRDIAMLPDGQPRIATSHMFHFSQRFIDDYLPYTIELGRSFVRLEYQSTRTDAKAIYVLDNLWDGLGSLTVLNPDIKYLFGKVTMYPTYKEVCRNMILYFINKYFPDPDRLVTPIKALETNTNVAEMEAIFNGGDFKNDLRILNARVREQGVTVPPLVHAYMSLSPTMRMFGTAVNDEFGDVEESGILLTIDDIFEEKNNVISVVSNHKYIMSDILTPLTAVSPIDGRYHDKTASLSDYFSEYATIRYRIMVEVEYFIALSQVGLPQLPALDAEKCQALRNIYRTSVFTVDEAQKVKDIEKVTNHDVKAVEYYLKEQFDALGLGDVKEFIHFGLTSQDINNTAFPMMFRDGLRAVVEEYKKVWAQLFELSRELVQMPMLARTHGQPASPTTLGKELAVFLNRMRVEIDNLLELPPRPSSAEPPATSTPIMPPIPVWTGPLSPPTFCAASASNANISPPRFRTTTASPHSSTACAASTP